ncbi:MAG: hypothetical protein DWI29_00870 [Planctomycetota bacterium]|nr:MAG: hypothetical protein DWI29_00870 [Planctomycetota bacterium]
MIGPFMRSGDCIRIGLIFLPIQPVDRRSAKDCDRAYPVGCDKQRAGTPNHKHGVPALALVPPCKITDCPAMSGT